MSDSIAAIFGDTASTYKQARPDYPEALYQEIFAQLHGDVLALDCASGSGQAVLPLCRRFKQVVATDRAHAQLLRGPRPDNLRAIVADACATPLPAHSIDLMTVAQALHWFDTPRFYDEVRRLLKPSGLFAAWSYGLLSIEPKLDQLIQEFHDLTLGADWAPQRRHVVKQYATINLPLNARRRSQFSLQRWWQPRQLEQYLASWSGLIRHQRRTGTDALAPLMAALTARWPEHEQRRIEWPLTLITARP